MKPAPPLCRLLGEVSLALPILLCTGIAPLPLGALLKLELSALSYRFAPYIASLTVTFRFVWLLPAPRVILLRLDFASVLSLSL